MKLSLLSVILLLSSVAKASYYSNCKSEVEPKAKKLIQLLDKYNADYGIADDEIADTKVTFEKDTFCTDMFAPLTLCTILRPAYALGDLRAENVENQSKIDQALLAYGKKFKTRGETEGFECSLKEHPFDTL